MTFPKRSLIASALTIALVGLVGNFQLTQATAAYSEITLGSAENYLLLAGSAITNGASTSFGGDGSRVTGIAPTLAAAGIGDSLIASGSTRFDDAGDTATAAQADLAIAFSFVDSLTVANPRAVISNETLTAGVYGTENAVALAVSGTITLDGAGDNRSIFIIRTGSALDFAASTRILLVNGAQASNVYWVAGSALTLGATSNVSGNLLARSAMTIGASSVVTGSFLTQGAITLGGSVVTRHQLRIAYVAPTPTPTPTVEPAPAPAPEPVVIYTPAPVVVFPSPTPTLEVVVVPEPIIEIIPTPSPTPTPELTILPIPIATPTATASPDPSPVVVVEEVLVAPKPIVTAESLPVETYTTVIPEVALEESSKITRADFPIYDPLQHPRDTTRTAVAAFAILAVISTGAVHSQGFLAQVARGGAIAVGIREGSGDLRRARKARVSGRPINFFTVLATRISSTSPLAARTISDASYLRASLGSFSLLAYPAAIFLGIYAAIGTSFQGLPPSLYLLIAMMALGIVDAMAGFIAGIVFSICVIAAGNVRDLATFLTLAGIVLLSYSPAILAGTFRPLRRMVDNSRAFWERSTDYIIASLLSGWVVKQIAEGLPGLSGLELPIATHADALGLTAGGLILVRFAGEDLVSYLLPGRIRDLEPEYHDRNIWQRVLTAVMQILVFGLVAQPFIGWRPELWIGLGIFALPIFFAVANLHFPQSRKIDFWLPTGVIEVIVMTMLGFLLVRVLESQDYSPERYVLLAFIILSIPTLIVKLLRLFAGVYEYHWRDSRLGNFAYRVLGLVALGLLAYIVFIGF